MFNWFFHTNILNTIHTIHTNLFGKPSKKLLQNLLKFKTHQTTA